MIYMYNDVNVMIKKYTMWYDMNTYFDWYTQPNLDFEKYDFIFQDIEKPYEIDYKHWWIRNQFGACNFNKLSTGMKSILNYLYFCESMKDKKDNLEFILNMGHMGKNIQRYFLRYANYYEMPFFFDIHDVTFYTKNFDTDNEILRVPYRELTYCINEIKMADMFDADEYYFDSLNKIDEEENRAIAYKLWGQIDLPKYRKDI